MPATPAGYLGRAGAEVQVWDGIYLTPKTGALPLSSLEESRNSPVGDLQPNVHVMLRVSRGR